MKIISKNSVTEAPKKIASVPKQNSTAMPQVITPTVNPTVSPANNSVVTTVETAKTPPRDDSAKVKPKAKEDIVHLRKAHIEKERERRKKKKQKKVQNAKNKNLPAKTAPKKPGSLEEFYLRFVSLLRFNITFKLTVGYGIRLVFLIVTLFIVAYASFSFYLYYQAQKTIETYESHLLNFATSGSLEGNSIFNEFITKNNISFHMYDTEHTVLYSSTTPGLLYNEAIAEAPYDVMEYPVFPTITQSGLVSIDGIDQVYVIKMDLTEAQKTIESTFPIGITLCIVLILSSIGSASKMANKHLKSIHILTEQVKDMSANNLSTRLNLSGTKDELKDLASTFNTMLDDIQKSYEREKQFVSDASHELRTPIAVIKGYAGMLNRWGKDDPAILEESIQAILGETENMHSLVESLLFIARNDKGALKMDLTNFNLSELLQEIVKETKLIDTNHTITESIDANLYVYGSADKLKQAFRIFIDNSIKYTPDEGHIKIEFKHTEKHNVLILSDNGIGISKEDLPHIFDRFYRADKSRTKLKENQHGGTGLGLSIAKIIIEQHKGRIHVESHLNEGTTFTILLPRVAETQ